MGHDLPPGRTPRPWAAIRSPGALAAGACLALGGLSLAVPYQLDGDAWSWIVWGREVRDLSLSLPGGSAWKPLPVLFTTVFSLLGDAAPALWLWVVRASWLGCLVLGYRVAARLGGRIAGVIAVLGLLLIPNPGAGWLNYFLQGDSEPVLAVALLGAIESHVAGRRVLAAGFGALTALGRPEAWPLLVLYAALQWRRSAPRDRAAVAVLVALVPALWLGGGLWGSGELLASPLRAREGSDAARERAGPVPWQQLLLGFASYIAATVSQLVLAPLWVAAVGGVVAAARRLRAGAERDGAEIEVALAAGAVGWIVLDVAGVLIGLPAGPRFFFAPAVLICLLGGSAVGRAVRAAARRGWEVAVAGGLAVALVLTALPRLSALADTNPRDLVVPAAIGKSLRIALRRTDATRHVRRCGGQVVVGAAPARAREAAWRLRLSLTEVRSVERTARIEVQRGVVIDRGTRATPPGWRRLGGAGRWTVYEVGCRRR